MAGARRLSVHLALRAEAAVHRVASRAALRRGYRPGILPLAAYGGPTWARVVARVVLVDPGSGEGRDRPAWRPFLTLEQPGVAVEIETGGVRRTAVSDARGYVDETVDADLTPGWGTAVLRLPDPPPAATSAGAAGSASAVTRLRVVDPAEDFGIVSDIDDTVIVTMLPRPLLAAWNTFFRYGQARRPVPGMAALYAALLAEHPRAPIVYLSTGAWNAAGALRRFLARTGYPAGPLLLTDWGPTPAGWFRSGQAHKRAALLRLAQEFPQVRWLLVGDDGQHDPALYAEFAAARPDRVRGIAIRQLTPAQAVLAHGTPTATDAPAGEPGYPAPALSALSTLSALSALSADEAVPTVPTAPTVRGADGVALATQLRAVGLLHAAHDVHRGG